MPRTVIGTFSRAYSASGELRLPYYGCNIAHVEPQVTKIFAKLLPEARAAVFGEYEILFLFTYTDTKGGTTCFVQTLRRNFSELADVSGLIDTLNAQDIADIDAEASFAPQVECRRAKPSCNWDVDITGTLVATFTCDGASPARPAEFSEAAADDEGVAGGGHVGENGTASSGGESTRPSGGEDRKAEAPAGCRRIGEPENFSFDDMCEMSPEEIDLYLNGGSRKEDESAEETDRL